MQISYLGFCALGGLTNKKLFTRTCHKYTTKPKTTYWRL
jgi:hypothetical protein